eukprot:TRINITY_DN10386_c0_g1_i1.p1 TRINITY_DN10386_c0_g1~~TRINITY_DN10386_c0_g1_i1.p1  ORF type:complete len:641 (+),score=205.12 TRINITY_DN10386_c0_g1_i1:133-2055(+)
MDSYGRESQGWESGGTASASSSSSQPFPSLGSDSSLSGSLSQRSMWDSFFDDNEEDDEGEYGTKNRAGSNKDCIIFLIDSSPEMFLPDADGEVPFHNAVKCARLTMEDKVISSENDLIGVCFYATAQKNNSNDFEGIYVAHDLDVPEAQRILDLERICEKNEAPYGHCANQFPFRDALWTCSSMFSSCATKVGHKRIFLFTNDDNPNAGDMELRKQALQRVRDLEELGVDVELFALTSASNTFDPSKFYQHIISVSDEDNPGQFEAVTAAKFEELQMRIRRKEHKKRAMGRLPLIIGDLEIGVGMYKLVREAKKSSFFWLDAKSNQRIKTETKWVCMDTGSLLSKDHMAYYYPYGGEKVRFEAEEIQDIKTIDKPGLRLMGFKPSSTLKPHFNIKSSSFIYPDETIVKGSTTAFAAILDRMLALDQIGIARLTQRANTAPRFVALAPQREEFDEDGVQLLPPGLHVLYLPFADDIRALDLPHAPTASTEQIVSAKKMVKTLRVRFDSQNFENPALQKHFAALQAIALEREVVDDIEDHTLPDEEGMMEHSDVLEEFRDSTLGNDPVGSVTVGRKRGAADDGGAPSKRRATTVDESDFGNEAKVKKMTVPQIKEILSAKKIAFESKMKKADLVQLLVSKFS